MSLFNTAHGYGALTKLLHWTMAGVLTFQIAAGAIMTALPAQGRALGLDQAAWFNWHKSIGLVAFGLVLLRIWNRRTGELPPWAATLSESERHFIHRAEQVLYAAMVAMPVSGFLYVMAGGYGVHLFGLWHLPNPIGQSAWLAAIARWVHVAGGWALLAAIAGHVGLVLRHHLILKDGLLQRMLPATGRKRDG